MRRFDLLRISLKNLKGRWAVLPALGIAISTFSLCFAGAVQTTVQKEKGQPYVLKVSTKGSEKLKDDTVAKISELPDVIGATPLLQVTAAVKAGVYSANLTLTGVKPSFIKDKFAEGAAFPDSSGMPYIVLNKAACKLFSNEKAGTTNVFNASVSSTATLEAGQDTHEEDVKLPEIDWLKAGFLLQCDGDTSWAVAKVSGLLEGDDPKQEPAAYISLSAAKELLLKSGTSTDYTGINIRIRNMGCTASVTEAIKNMGLEVTNGNDDLQAKWDAESKEMIYLTVIGIFSLVCSLVLISAWRKICLLEQNETWEMLRWIGMREKDIGRLFFLQVMMLSLLGVLIGIIVSISLPSFLQQDAKDTSIFKLQIPLMIAVLSASTGIFVPMLRFFFIKNKNS